MLVRNHCLTITAFFCAYTNVGIAQHAVNSSDGLTAAGPTTGTQLNHTAISPSLSLQIFTREDILLSGENNVGDFLRSLPINTFGSFRPQSGTTSQENTVISLRGLGSSNSLILIDGRRLPKSTTIGSGSNLNLVPLGAVERIEILAESASAIYGSDATAGVVNIITRKNFQGAEFTLGAGSPSIPEQGGERESGSVIMGTSTDRSRLMAGVSWNDREMVLQRDVPWTVRGASVYGNSFTSITDGFDNFDWTSFISGCDFPGGAFYPVPHVFSNNGTRCAYDFSLVAAEDASTENKAFFASASYQLTDQWQINADMMFSQAESFAQMAPVPDSSFFLNPLSVDSPNNPTNPNSPLFDPNLGLAPQAVNWWHRFDALGNRDTTIQTQLLDMHLSLAGKLGRFDFFSGIRHTDNRTADVTRNLLLRGAAHALVENGSYDLANPYAASEATLNAMRFTQIRDARFDQDELYAQLETHWFSLPGGDVHVMLAASVLQEKYQDLLDPQSEAGLVAGTAGASVLANRDTEAIFLEGFFPVMDSVSVNIAARYEDYSDVGDDLASKVAVRYQPIEKLRLSASYSENHQAPSLPFMNSFNSTSFTNIRDPFIGCFVCNYNILEIRQANSALQSEQTDHFTFNVNYQPSSWLDMRLNYWNIKTDNRIRTITAQQVRDAEVNGETLPPGIGCERLPNGTITQCTTGYINGGFLKSSGVDLHAELTFNVMNGQLSHELIISHVLDFYLNDNNNLIGSAGLPENRAILNNQFAWNNWQFAYNINLIGEHDGVFGQSLAAPNWVTHDVQLNYHTPWQSTLTLGAQNIGEKYPPIVAGALTNREYQFDLYDGFGRIVYARYSQTF